MEFTFYTFVKILGSLAVFIYGMKLMSEGIQRAAGNSLRSILRSFTKSKIRGLITGFFTTAIIQSSSATTVMTVSLVNAGLITLVESVGLMMGANIGTTITAWIIATLGFRFDIYSLILPLFLVGLPLILNTKGKLKYWGEFVIGFAILFMGLNYLQQSIPDINTDSEFVNWIRDSTGSGVMVRFLFVAIGALMTIIIQSSSAAIVLTMTMCVKGWISFELGACLVMGENIGTTITAEVASLIGNKNARRSARIHTLFNIIGVLWMVLLLPFFLQGISWITQTLFHQENPMLVPSSRDYGLASFHTLFNLTNVVLLLPFSYYLIKVAKMTVLAGEDQEVSRLKFFGGGIKTPELAIMELKKEVSKYASIIHRMHGFSKELLNNVSSRNHDVIKNRIDKYEEITDKMELEIVDYISTLSKEEVSFSTSITLRSMLNVCNEFERIGDAYYKIGEDIEYKKQNKIWFSPAQRNNLNELVSMIDFILLSINENLQADDPNSANTAKTEELIATANVLSRHISKPLARVPDIDEGIEALNVKGAVIYDNILYQYCKIIENCENVVDYVKGGR